MTKGENHCQRTCSGKQRARQRMKRQAISATLQQKTSMTKRGNHWQRTSLLCGRKNGRQRIERDSCSILIQTTRKQTSMTKSGLRSKKNVFHYTTCSTTQRVPLHNVGDKGLRADDICPTLRYYNNLHFTTKKLRIAFLPKKKEQTMHKRLLRFLSPPFQTTALLLEMLLSWVRAPWELFYTTGKLQPQRWSHNSNTPHQLAESNQQLKTFLFIARAGHHHAKTTSYTSSRHHKQNNTVSVHHGVFPGYQPLS